MGKDEIKNVLTKGKGTEIFLLKSNHPLASLFTQLRSDLKYEAYLSSRI